MNTLKKGDVLGDWRLRSELGSGGQGTVWKVRYGKDPHSPPGALKMCLDGSTKARARFQQEIALLREQDHPSIVRVRDSGQHEGSPYFVMELATTSLASVAASDTAGVRLIRESRELLLRFVRQACTAVAALHDNEVLHRDIKPSNILLMLEPPEPMRAVVADLGIASPELGQGKLTATHETIGTPAFRAPEALTGQHSKRSDVYSMGKTIEAVLNRGDSVNLGPGKCLRDQRLTDELWNSLDEILSRACAYDPAARYENASELLAALPQFVLGLGADGEAGQSWRLPTITLSTAERLTLSDVIGACPTSGERAALSVIRRETQLGDYQFSLALRRLEDLGFLETVVVEDMDGDRYTVVEPTENGVNWAQSHQAAMEEAIAEFAPKQRTEDDIPF